MTYNLTEIQALQLNPLTPMAFLTPMAAYQATIAAYVIVGSVAALIWDILIHVDSAFKLLFRLRIGLPTVVYFLSRISVLAYVLLNVIFSTAALPNCQAIERTICVLYHITFSSTAFLFFLRVRAVFDKNRYIVAFFAMLWLAVLGSSLTVATVANAVNLGPTRHCVDSKLKPYASSAPIAFAINDTFVFLAISWKLLSTMVSFQRQKTNIKSMILGKYLPAFSRALLQDGQIYYLVSVTSNIIVVVISWAGAPLAYRLMFTNFNVALTNMMACRVFRHTKLGNFGDTISTRRLESQIRHLDLETGNGNGRMQSLIRFVSLQRTENEAATDTDLHRRDLREGDTVMIEKDKKVAGSATKERTEPRGNDSLSTATI